jgi:hypothetical protein
MSSAVLIFFEGGYYRWLAVWVNWLHNAGFCDVLLPWASRAVVAPLPASAIVHVFSKVRCP